MSRLFYEDERDAVRSMIAAANKTVQECAHHLWPRMKPQSAYAKLYAQLNGNDDGEQLKFAEVIELMRFCQTLDALLYSCDETLHARPARMAPDDKKLELAAVLREASTVMRQTLDQLQRLDQQ